MVEVSRSAKTTPQRALLNSAASSRASAVLVNDVRVSAFVGLALSFACAWETINPMRIADVATRVRWVHMEKTRDCIMSWLGRGCRNHGQQFPAAFSRSSKKGPQNPIAGLKSKGSGSVLPSDS